MIPHPALYNRPIIGVPAGYGGAPLGGAPVGQVPFVRAVHPYAPVAAQMYAYPYAAHVAAAQYYAQVPHPYAAPFPSAPYTSMYSMSPQAYYSFAEVGSKLSAYKSVRARQLKERAEAKAPAEGK